MLPANVRVCGVSALVCPPRIEISSLAHCSPKGAAALIGPPPLGMASRGRRRQMRDPDMTARVQHLWGVVRHSFLASTFDKAVMAFIALGKVRRPRDRDHGRLY